MDKAEQHIRERHKQMSTGATATGAGFIDDATGANAITKLSRYEAAIERSLYRAMHELQRLQTARLIPGNTPAPLAIDVTVDDKD